MQQPLLGLISGVGVEIGVWKGQGAEAMLGNNNIKRLYLVDPYQKAEEFKDCELPPANFEFDKQGEYILEAVKRTQERSEKAFFVFARSIEAARAIEEPLDFVYIDGNHNYEYVKQDIETWYPKLMVGGILSGHDYPTESVSKAVDEFVKEKGLKLEGTTPDWWCYKVVK